MLTLADYDHPRVYHIIADLMLVNDRQQAIGAILIDIVSFQTMHTFSRTFVDLMGKVRESQMVYFCTWVCSTFPNSSMVTWKCCAWEGEYGDKSMLSLVSQLCLWVHCLIEVIIITYLLTYSYLKCMYTYHVSMSAIVNLHYIIIIKLAGK